MKTGKIKERQVKLIEKNPYEPNTDVYHYAEAGESVTWDGGSNEGYEEFYGGRRVLWCTLWSGESIGLREEEVEWDEDTD